MKRRQPLFALPFQARAQSARFFFFAACSLPILSPFDRGDGRRFPAFYIYISASAHAAISTSAAFLPSSTRAVLSFSTLCFFLLRAGEVLYMIFESFRIDRRIFFSALRCFVEIIERYNYAADYSSIEFILKKITPDNTRYIYSRGEYNLAERRAPGERERYYHTAGSLHPFSSPRKFSHFRRTHLTSSQRKSRSAEERGRESNEIHAHIARESRARKRNWRREDE